MITPKIQTAMMLSALRKAKWRADQDKSYWGSNEEIFTLYETNKRISDIVGFDIVTNNHNFLWGQAIDKGHVPTIIDENIKHLIKYADIASEVPVYLVAFSKKHMTAFDFSEGKIDIELLTDLSSLSGHAVIETVAQSDYEGGGEIVSHTPMVDVLESMSAQGVIYSRSGSENGEDELNCLLLRLV